MARGDMRSTVLFPQIVPKALTSSKKPRHPKREPTANGIALKMERHSYHP
jgi:hypothetical protein